MKVLYTMYVIGVGEIKIFMATVTEDQPLTGIETNIEVCVNNLQRVSQ